MTFLGVLRHIFQNLTGKAADEHQGVFDFMADMGRHIAQGGQALTPHQFLLHPFPFPEVSKVPDHADLPVIFVKHPGRQPDGYEGAVLMSHPGFIVFYNALSAIAQDRGFLPRFPAAWPGP